MKKKKYKHYESEEDRLERIRMWRTTATRVVPNKKKYNRKRDKKVSLV